MIRIQPDTVNTGKGHDWGGHGVKRMQPSRGWHLVSSNFSLSHSAGWGEGLAHGTQPHNGGSGSRGSVAFAQRGEMPFSQRSSLLTRWCSWHVVIL